MSGIVAIIVKLMPSSPSVSLDQIMKEARHVMEKEGAKNISFETQEIAFGLKAIMMKFAIDEDKGTDIVEQTLSKIKDVSSVTIEDYRRAFG